MWRATLASFLILSCLCSLNAQILYQCNFDNLALGESCLNPVGGSQMLVSDRIAASGPSSPTAPLSDVTAALTPTTNGQLCNLPYSVAPFAQPIYFCYNSLCRTDANPTTQCNIGKFGHFSVGLPKNNTFVLNTSTGINGAGDQCLTYYYYLFNTSGLGQHVQATQQESDGASKVIDYVRGSPYNGWIKRQIDYTAGQQGYKIYFDLIKLPGSSISASIFAFDEISIVQGRCNGLPATTAMTTTLTTSTTTSTVTTTSTITTTTTSITTTTTTPTVTTTSTTVTSTPTTTAAVSDTSTSTTTSTSASTTTSSLTTTTTTSVTTTSPTPTVTSSTTTSPSSTSTTTTTTTSSTVSSSSASARSTTTISSTTSTTTPTSKPDSSTSEVSTTTATPVVIPTASSTTTLSQTTNNVVTPAPTKPVSAGVSSTEINDKPSSNTTIIIILATVIPASLIVASMIGVWIKRKMATATLKGASHAFDDIRARDDSSYIELSQRHSTDSF